MSSRRFPSPNKKSNATELKYIFLRGGTSHIITSPAIHFKDILHPTRKPHHSDDEFDELPLNERLAAIADGFTDKHKKTMSSLRQEMKEEEQVKYFDDALRVLEAPTRPATNNSELKHRDRFINVFKNGDSEIFLGDKESIDELDQSVLSYDYMSGIWRMMQCERADKEFLISPKGFEFDKEKTKWVPKSDKVMKQVESSKNKCEEWLIKKCQPNKDSMLKISNKI